MEQTALNLDALESLIAKAKELEQKANDYSYASGAAQSACHTVSERIKDDKARDDQQIADLKEAIPQSTGAKRALLEAQLHGLQERAGHYQPTEAEKQFVYELMDDADSKRGELSRAYNELMDLKRMLQENVEGALKGITGKAWNLCGPAWKTREEYTQEAFEKLYRIYNQE